MLKIHGRAIALRNAIVLLMEKRKRRNPKIRQRMCQLYRKQPMR
jgi:hypothetical protein